VNNRTDWSCWLTTTPGAAQRPRPLGTFGGGHIFVADGTAGAIRRWFLGDGAEDTGMATKDSRRSSGAHDRKGPARSAARGGGGGRANALQKPLRPSAELAAVVGPEPLPRTEAVAKVWAHIRAHDLQNPENRREIIADDKLRKVFGKDRVTMFEMNKHLASHLR
jgi:upstream activation factor subunit UAF30